MLEPVSDADPDRISRFLDLCHQKGMIVLSYYPFTFTKQLAEIHPEWMIQMFDDGQHEIWNEGWFCVNSSYRDWLPEYLAEMFDNLDFDGTYFDDSNWGSHSDTGQRHAVGCCCRYCQELYLVETEKQLPTKLNLGFRGLQAFHELALCRRRSRCPKWRFRRSSCCSGLSRYGSVACRARISSILRHLGSMSPVHGEPEGSAYQARTLLMLFGMQATAKAPDPRS